MTVVIFKKDGGPIVAEVKCGYAQPGAYKLFLWEANVNKVVMRKEGNFINPDDDSYQLPTPNQDNDARIVDCLATIVITPPIKDYQVDLRISQDGNDLGVVTASGQSDASTVIVELFVKLELESE
jgi:hypothetical protein